MKKTKKLKKPTKRQILDKENKIKKRELKRRIEEWKKKIIVRDNLVCQRCKKLLMTRKNCHPHHIISERSVIRNFPELIDDINNGTLLCFPCHTASPSSSHESSFEFIYWLKMNKPRQYAYLTNFLDHKILEDSNEK